MQLDVQGGVTRYIEAGKIYAYVISGEYVADGVEFLTEEESEFQLGIMTRNQDTPVFPHRHNPIERHIATTSEFLYFRQGSAQVSLRSTESAAPVTIILKASDSILFTGIGIHGIVFSDETQLIEIKQGPFDPRLDKVYLSHLES